MNIYKNKSISLIILVPFILTLTLSIFSYFIIKLTNEQNIRTKSYYNICKIECSHLGYVCVDKCLQLKTVFGD